MSTFSECFWPLSPASDSRGFNSQFWIGLSLFFVDNDSRRPPGAVAAFSRFRRRDISDFTYLLTYLQERDFRKIWEKRRKIIKRKSDICIEWSWEEKVYNEIKQKCCCQLIVFICTVLHFVAVTVLLAMSVYQLIVSDKLPSSSESVPVIGQ